jgi:hypothetical protein
MRNRTVPLSCAAALPSGTLGCLTSGVIYESGKGDSALGWVTAIQTAQLSGDELFLTINARRPSDSPPVWQTLIVRTRLSEIESIGPTDLAPANPPIHKSPSRLKVRVKTARSIPDDARPVPVIPITLSDVSELPEFVNQLPNEVHVLLVSIRTYDQLERNPQSLGMIHPHSHSTLLSLVRPSDKGELEIGLTKGFKDKSKKRRAWLLLTPLTVAADVVTFPLQLLAILAIDS